MARSKKSAGFPRPQNGLVIRYSSLWHRERRQGREEGTKDRPCAVILVMRTAPKETVIVLAVTHSRPLNPELALEIPQQTKKRLGLDSDRSWIVLDEANRFEWPGPDLRPLSRDNPSSVVYGVLPEAFYDTLRRRFIQVLEANRARVVGRAK